MFHVRRETPAVGIDTGIGHCAWLLSGSLRLNPSLAIGPVVLHIVVAIVAIVLIVSITMIMEVVIVYVGVVLIVNRSNSGNTSEITTIIIQIKMAINRIMAIVVMPAIT